MKKIFVAAVLSILFLGSNQLSAQVGHHKRELVNAKITQLKYGSEGKYFILDYELPYEGMMEIRIFDEKDELVWREQYLNASGSNKIRLKAGAFQEGLDYTIQLNYKRNEIRKKMKFG